MAAGEFPDDERRCTAYDRRNDCRQATPVRELCVQEWVVLVELLTELISNNFEAGLKLAGLEGNGIFSMSIPSRSYHHEESGLPMISLMLSSSSSG